MTTAVELSQLLSADISSSVQKAFTAALEQRFPLEPVSPLVQLSQVLGLKASPKSGDVIVIGDDGKVEVKSQIGSLLEKALGTSISLGAPITAPIEGAIPDLLGLPLGAIFVGGFTGLIVGDLIDTFQPPKTAAGQLNYINLVVKGGAIWVLAMYGHQAMSGPAVMFAGGILLLQMIADIFPLSRWLSSLINIFTKRAQPTGIGTVRQDFPTTYPGHAPTNGYVPQVPARQIYPSPGSGTTDQLKSLFGPR